MIKAVIFDLDGTLIDSENFYVDGTIKWLSQKGISLEYSQICKIIGMTMEETYNHLSNISGLSKEDVIKCNTNFFDKNKIVFKELIYDDVSKMFDVLKKANIKICICSMSPKKYIEDFIKECNLIEYVDYYLSGDDCQNNKPDPEIYNKMISLLGIDVKEVLIVEDATSGLKAAKSSGAYVVGRNSEKFGFNQSDAMYLFKDLIELNTIIMEINNGRYN